MTTAFMDTGSARSNGAATPGPAPIPGAATPGPAPTPGAAPWSDTPGTAFHAVAEDPIYGGRLEDLTALKDRLLSEVDAIRAELKAQRGEDPVEHCLGRIKSPDSLREKCERKAIPQTGEVALEYIHDIVGIRVVCTFLDDVYVMRDRIAALPGVEVVEEKDYIRHVKPNGYRSFHMILRFDKDLYAEVQIRTISQDTWAALEHQIKYKHNVIGNIDLITKELKRCADELASTDLSMQTIREMICPAPSVPATQEKELK